MKYWAYVNNEILGPFEKGKLLELPSFSPSLLVCPQTPVGEKTEDWKEASTYPELSALIGQGSMAAAQPEAFPPAPAAQPAPAPAAEALSKPAIETPSLSFKPLTPSQSVEPVPPAEHAAGAFNIAVNRLGKAGAEPAPALQPQHSSSDFDPISLSRIERRSETISAQNQPAQAQPPQEAPAEGIALEPPRAFSQPEQLPPVLPAPEPAPAPFSPAAGPAAAPVIETFSRPASAAPVADLAGLEKLVQRLDALSKAAATRQDINSAVDPLRMKLDQMGEVISSIKNSQFQREVMDKLVYLENAVGELKAAFRNPQQALAPAAAPKLEMQSTSDTVFGVQPSKQAEKPKAEPAREPAKPAEIADTGSQPSRLKPALKKIGRLIVTLVLLAAVALGAVIGLKNFGVFDATKFIPFRLPFVAAPPAQPKQDAGAAEKALTDIQQPALEPQGAQPGLQPDGQQAPQPTPEEQEELRKVMSAKAMQELAPKKAMKPELVPEIIYLTRTFKLKAGGTTLENKIYEHAAMAGGDFNRTGWEVSPAADGLYEIVAVIPAKTNNLNYTFLVDRAKKTVTPSNDPGKAAYELLVRESAPKPPKKASKRKAAAKPAPRPQPKKAAPKKQAAPEEEYEYVYEEESGTEQ